MFPLPPRASQQQQCTPFKNAKQHPLPRLRRVPSGYYPPGGGLSAMLSRYHRAIFPLPFPRSRGDDANMNGFRDSGVWRENDL